MPVLEAWYKLPTSGKVKGPVAVWYFNLFMPAVAYGVALLLSLVFTRITSFVFILALVYIGRFGRNASHRLEHCSRLVFIQSGSEVIKLFSCSTQLAL